MSADREFPAYVPAAIRQVVNSILDGDSFYKGGAIAHAATLSAELDHANRQLNWIADGTNSPPECPACGSTICATASAPNRPVAPDICCHCGSNWREKLAKSRLVTQGAADFFHAHIACTLRLSGLSEDRKEEAGAIKDAYKYLGAAIEKDEQWHLFFDAALVCAGNYSQYRPRKKKAEKLLTEITHISDTLIDKITELRSLGVMLPKALSESANKGTWFVPDESKIDYALRIQTQLNSNKINDDYDIIEHLKRASSSAMNAENRLFGVHISAAIAKQKSSPRTECIRAFCRVLSSGPNRIELTSSVLNAVAVAASVARNDADDQITYDDVRKALEHFGGKGI